MRVGVAHQKKELGRIGPDFIDDFPHRDELAGPLRHFHFFPAAQQIHHLDQHDLEAIFRIPIGLHHRLHARNVAMVIRAPDVDEEIISAPQLILVVGDIGSQIGVLAVLFPHDTILLVTECRGSEPPGTFLLKQEMLRFQFIQNPLDGPRVHERGLAEPRLELDAEGFQILANQAQQFLIGERSTALLDLCGRMSGQLGPELLLHSLGHGSDVGPAIPL
jgi:hypothetical protein